MLSGNPPLVHVLREALAEDAAHREGTKKEARRRAQAALQTLLGYLKQHGTERNPPPEHVIVYDEAQRAWDEETGKKLLGRLRSEPALFLEIMSRQPWSCLVCLVGPGKKLIAGKEDSRFGDKRSRSSEKGNSMECPRCREAIKGDSSIAGNGLFDSTPPNGLKIIEEPIALFVRSSRVPEC